MRLWARTTSDYSKAFSRIRDAVVALPVDSAVLDGEAMRWFCGAENEEPEVSSMADLSAQTAETPDAHRD